MSKGEGGRYCPPPRPPDKGGRSDPLRKPADSGDHSSKDPQPKPHAGRHNEQRGTLGDPDASPGSKPPSQRCTERTDRPQTPGRMTYNERSSNFCQRIYKGIKSAISSHEDGHPPTARTHTVPRTMAAGTMPTYGGVNDLETFMQWLYDFLRFLNTHPPMGKTQTHHHITMMRLAMTGPAKTWFNTFT